MFNSWRNAPAEKSEHFCFGIPYDKSGKTHYMYKKNYFERLVDVVADLSELSANTILHGRKTDEVVDARWIIVRLLSEYGYHTSKIAMLMQMSQRNVTHILTVFQDRLDQYDSLFKITYQKARVEVRNLKET